MSDSVNLVKVEVLNAVRLELQHQIDKYGEDKEQSLEGFLICLERKLNQAKDAWYTNELLYSESATRRLVQIAALSLACLDQCCVEADDDDD